MSTIKPKGRQVLTAFSLILLTMGVAVALTIVVTQQIVNSNVSSMEELALHDARSINNSLSLRWREMENVAEKISESKFSSTAEVSEVLRKYVSDVTSADFIALVTADGTEYRSTGLVFPNAQICEIAQGQTQRFVARYNESKAMLKENRKEMLVMGVPVKIAGPDNESGEPTEFTWLFARLGIATLEDELKIDSYNGEGFSSVIDFDGNYIVNMSRSHSIGTFDNFFEDLEGAKFNEFSNIDELKEFMASGGRSVVYTNKDGAKNIMVLSDLDFADWYFITTVPSQVFDSQTSNIMAIFISLMALVLLVFCIVFFLSLRQRKQDEKLKVAEAENRAKTTFLFNMSHDIRTPMNAILGFTDIAINHIDERTKVRDCLTKIKSSSSILLSIINDVLEMSRIEAGKLEVSESPVNLANIGNHFNPMVESLAREKNISYAYEVRNLQDQFVFLDLQHMNRALVNVLTNAVKYTKDGGKVSFVIEQTSSVNDNGQATYRFIITDTGIGMSKDFIENNLFQQFSRETTSTLSKQQGTGLGLAIVKRIIDTLGGTIQVESVLDKGTTFTIAITLKTLSAQEIEENYGNADTTEEKIADIAVLHGKKVLLVEDNALNREIATEILQDVGVVVETATDGSLALETVAQKGVDYFDFVLMDIQMPVMDGYEATQAIRKLPGGDRVVIIALSANAFEEDRLKSLSIGMNNHIAKPIDIDELVAALVALS